MAAPLEDCVESADLKKKKKKKRSVIKWSE